MKVNMRLLGVCNRPYCPNCGSGAQTYNYDRIPKLCKGEGLFWYLFCRLHKGMPHYHYKCWDCKAQYHVSMGNNSQDNAVVDFVLR